MPLSTPPRATHRTPACLVRNAVAIVATALLLAACAHRDTRDHADARWRNARQLVLVTSADWDAANGTLRTYTRTRGGWQIDGEATPVSLGHSGAAWGLGLHPDQTDAPVKREGDKRAPAGVFAIGPAFGYARSQATALPYAQMQASSWCVDVVDSPLYNRIVDSKDVGDAAVAGSTEPMRRDLQADGDELYRMGFVIEHNAQGRKGAGSCIFAHLWRAPGTATAGCTAMAPPAMERLYGWLRPEAHPVFVLLPQAEYQQLKSAWNLPL
ncbi:MAG: L,D-transpeptidase family protein [Luteimonas sp.]